MADFQVSAFYEAPDFDDSPFRTEGGGMSRRSLSQGAMSTARVIRTQSLGIQHRSFIPIPQQSTLSHSPSHPKPLRSIPSSASTLSTTSSSIFSSSSTSTSSSSSVTLPRPIAVNPRQYPLGITVHRHVLFIARAEHDLADVQARIRQLDSELEGEGEGWLAAKRRERELKRLKRERGRWLKVLRDKRKSLSALQIQFEGSDWKRFVSTQDINVQSWTNFVDLNSHSERFTSREKRLQKQKEKEKLEQHDDEDEDDYEDEDERCYSDFSEGTPS